MSGVFLLRSCSRYVRRDPGEQGPGGGGQGDVSRRVCFPCRISGMRGMPRRYPAAWACGRVSCVCPVPAGLIHWLGRVWYKAREVGKTGLLCFQQGGIPGPSAGGLGYATSPLSERRVPGIEPEKGEGISGLRESCGERPAEYGNCNEEQDACYVNGGRDGGVGCNPFLVAGVVRIGEHGFFLLKCGSVR